jgi:hypothetical protein
VPGEADVYESQGDRPDVSGMMRSREKESPLSNEGRLRNLGSQVDTPGARRMAGHVGPTSNDPVYYC